VHHKRFADSDDTLLGTRDRALEHQEVVLHDTIVGEATHGCDGLLRDIRVGRCIRLVDAGTNAVNFLVKFGTVMVTICKFEVKTKTSE